MKLIACLLATALLPCVADDLSGPNRTTLVRASWGTVFYDPVATGPHQFKSSVEEFRILSRAGEVRLQGSELNGYKLSCGGDVLTAHTLNGDLEIRWQNQVWTWKVRNYASTLTTPKDAITFERSTNTMVIKGPKGTVIATTNPNSLTIQCSAGTASVTNSFGDRTFSGLALEQVPYLGRGVYISFHGIGLLIDVQKMFPMPEVAEWSEWKPILGGPFEQSAK